MRPRKELRKDVIAARVKLWSDPKGEWVPPQSLKQGCSLLHREGVTPWQSDVDRLL